MFEETGIDGRQWDSKKESEKASEWEKLFDIIETDWTEPAVNHRFSQ